MRPSAEEGRRLRGVRAVVAMATLGALALPVLASAPRQPPRRPTTRAPCASEAAARARPARTASSSRSIPTTRSMSAGPTSPSSSGWPAPRPTTPAAALAAAGASAGSTGRIIMDRDRVPAPPVGTSAPRWARMAPWPSASRPTGATARRLTLCTTGVNLLDGAWHHVALQRSTNGLMQIWVDGTNRALAGGPVGDASYPNGAGGSTYDPYLGFGAEKHDFGNQFPSYRGLFDEVRISTTWRYGATFGRPTAPFVPDGSTAAIYHLDGTPGALCSGAVPNATGGVAATCSANSNFPRFDANTPPWSSPPPPPPPPPPPGNTVSFHPITPSRLVDTREDAIPGPLVGQRGAAPGAGVGSARRHQCRGDGHDQPHGREPCGFGYLTAYPCTQPRPLASNLNYAPGQIVANQANIDVAPTAVHLHLLQRHHRRRRRRHRVGGDRAGSAYGAVKSDPATTTAVRTAGRRGADHRPPDRRHAPTSRPTPRPPRSTSR